MKRVLRVLIILAALFVFWPKTAVLAGPRVPILMYHYIGNNPNPADRARDSLSVSPDKFEAQLQYLANNGYTPISLDTLWAIFNGQAGSPAKPVVLTFDDGYMDFYYNAFPVLRKYGFHAVAFIPTGLMNQGYYLSWGQIKEMANSGLISFEAHGVTHKSLTSLSYAALKSELETSKAVLEGQTGQRVNFLAYPGGSANGLTMRLASLAGYVGGAGTWFGKASYPSMILPRIRINNFTSLAQFAGFIAK